jgi:hypothetical protein
MHWAIVLTLISTILTLITPVTAADIQVAGSENQAFGKRSYANKAPEPKLPIKIHPKHIPDTNPGVPASNATLHSLSRRDYTCGPGNPCSNGACCGVSGFCGYGG